MGILNKIDINIPPHETASRYTDLNIGQIAAAVSECWGSNVSRFYQDFAADSEGEQYRREVYAGIKKAGLYETLCTGCELMLQVLELAKDREKQVKRQQQMLTHVHEVQMYCRAVDELYRALCDKSIPDTHSEGLILLRDELAAYTQKPEYVAMRDEANALTEAVDGLNITFVYENDKLKFAVEDRPSKAAMPSTEAATAAPASKSLTSPFRSFNDLAGLELALIVHIIESRPEVFKRIKKFYSQYTEYREDFIMQFFDEIPFYLSYIKFERYMLSEGFEFTMASVDEARPMEAEELYDLALAIANIKRGRPVVRNGFVYEGDEQFFVLTGPNQGGKTTFARSLGQLVYLTKLGLPVPAKRANIHYFSDLLTHFSVEESIETGRGKLLEELVRLKPMMEQSGRHFVVINELFTTAANYDACIMGKKVLQHFIENNCCGIYVTHLTELLSGTDHATGLCAQLDDNGVQTFRILRRVMEYNNCAAAQINKYRLNYSELRARLGITDTSLDTGLDTSLDAGRKELV